MKGLLIKDLKLMLGGDQPFTNKLFIIAAFAVLGIVNFDPMEGFIGADMLVAVAAVGVRNYDVSDNELAFLLTMPVSRKEYVRESYIFEILSAGVLMLMLILLDIVLAIAVKPVSLQPADYLGKVWTSAAVILILIALLTPFYLYFGTGKASAVILIMIGGLFLGLFIALGEDVPFAVAAQAGFRMLLRFPVTMFILWISYLLSVRIMERKEF